MEGRWRPPKERHQGLRRGDEPPLQSRSSRKVTERAILESENAEIIKIRKWTSSVYKISVGSEGRPPFFREIEVKNI